LKQKIKKLCRYDQTEVVILFYFDRTRIGSILQQWCNSPWVNLLTKAFEEMLDCAEALDHVCPLFLQAEL
jgi:hypothetical protein